MIVKVIGAAPFAVSIILTVFMGGLGLGSFIAGKTIDRVGEPRRLLKLYALLELAIGGYGIILPGLIILSKPLYSLLYNQLFSHFLIYSVLTLIGCLVLLILPSACMGATLPILCRFYIVQLGHLGTRSGRLYALNTIGAAAGSFVCGFWLIAWFGVWGSLLSAVIINAAIGAVSLLASNSIGLGQGPHENAPPLSNAVPEQPDADEAALPASSAGHRFITLSIFALSGFCAMAYEVIWTRLLGLIIGPTTYSFTIILTTFITGLGIGSLLFGRMADRTAKPLRLLIYTQLFAALLALGVSQLLGNSQFFFAKLIYHFQTSFALLAAAKAGISIHHHDRPYLITGGHLSAGGENLHQLGQQDRPFHRLRLHGEYHRGRTGILLRRFPADPPFGQGTQLKSGHRSSALQRAVRGMLPSRGRAQSRDHEVDARRRHGPRRHHPLLLPAALEPAAACHGEVSPLRGIQHRTQDLRLVGGADKQDRPNWNSIRRTPVFFSTETVSADSRR